MQGILGGCSDCVIDNNLFDNNGYSKRVFNHNIYLSFHGNKNIIVSRNILRNSAIVDGKCSGVSLVVHGEVSYLTIEGNTIEEKAGAVENGCWGIAVDTGYAREEVFSNIIIKGNEIVNVGNVAIGCSSCVNVVIENNRITNANDTFSLANIKIPSQEEDSIKSDQVVVRNNIMVNHNSAIHVTGIDITLAEGSPLVEGNALFTTHDSQFCQKINGNEIVDSLSCKLHIQ
jgi:polygalacturonase